MLVLNRKPGETACLGSDISFVADTDRETVVAQATDRMGQSVRRELARQRE